MDQTVRPLQKKRTSNFREDETKLLIQLWGSPFIQKKLYLTHRKAPVMRILAASMQQRGFYRTPDEIKTRIRNLKCLYHRIKRSMTSGTGIGTIDPDWPHYKAMDAILNKQGHKKNEEENLLSGPRCEDIKQEIEIDINDDMESWATNDSMHGSETSEDPAPPMPNLHPAPLSKLLKPKPSEPIKTPQIQGKPMSTIIPNVSIPAQNFQIGNNAQKATGTVPSYPLPLLILNGLQPGPNAQGDKNRTSQTSCGGHNATADKEQNQELNNTLKALLETQRQTLEVEKERLEIEKQKMELEKMLGSQILTLVPIVSTILQRLALAPNQDQINSEEEITLHSLLRNGRKRTGCDDFNILKDSKILKTVLEQGIKKYMMDENKKVSAEKDKNEKTGKYSSNCKNEEDDDHVKDETMESENKN